MNQKTAGARRPSTSVRRPAAAGKRRTKPPKRLPWRQRLRGHVRRLRAPLPQAVVLSLLIHGLILGLNFEGVGPGLPGLGWPWRDRRIEVPDIVMRLVSAVAPRDESASTPPGARSAALPDGQPRRAAPQAPSLSDSESASATASATSPAPLSEVEPAGSVGAAAVTEARTETRTETSSSSTTEAVVPSVAERTTEALAKAPDAATEISTVAPGSVVMTVPVGLAALSRIEPLALPVDPPEPAPRISPREPDRRLADAPAAAASSPAPRAPAAAVEASTVQTPGTDATAAQDAARAELEHDGERRRVAARAQAARQAVVQHEAAQAEAARQAEAQQESMRQEAARQAAAQQEAVRAELARQEAARNDAARQEAARQEATRQEAARQELARQEIARQDAARQEASRQEAARQEAARQQAAREEATRALAAKADAEARREAALRAIGKQLDEEADRRAAAATARANARDDRPHAWSSVRRGRLFGRTDANAELALYGEAWARKIHLNTPPDTARELAARRLGTRPVVTVAVRSDGSVETVTFVVSSGVREVDDSIRRLVESLAPYPAFPPALARDYDVIEIRRSWQFDSAVWLE